VHLGVEASGTGHLQENTMYNNFTVDLKKNGNRKLHH
jgi:hypothetical protein